MKPELYVVEADRPQWFARLRFLYFIQKLSPETWATLREDVLPLYKRYVSDANASPYVFSEDGKTVMVTERTVRYAKAMRDWERRWNLHDSWLRDESRMALHLWATAGGHEWAPGLMSVLLSNLDAKRAEDASVEALGIQAPTLVSGPWNPTTERWSEYEKRTVHQVRKDLAHYRAEIEALTSLASWPRKRPRADRDAEQHLRWVVRFQVRRETQKAIADDPKGDGTRRSVEVSTVRDAIRTTTELLGLTRRSIATHE